MSEVMAIEAIAEEYAKFLGYFTETRVPFKLGNGSSSDFDVLGFNRKTDKTIVIECKAWGGPKDYTSFNTAGRKKQIKEIINNIIKNWAYFKKSPNNKWKLSELNKILLVIPGFCSSETKKELVHSVKLENKSTVEVEIMPIHELLMNIMIMVDDDKDERRKRYSNPALEFCRWLLRSYEHGHLDLMEVDLKLKKEKQTYDILKKNYFRTCLKAVKEKTKIRNAGINTRMNTLKILLRQKKAVTISELNKHAEKGNPDYGLSCQRLSPSLKTWKELGIIEGDKEKGFLICSSFKKIVKQELKGENE